MSTEYKSLLNTAATGDPVPSVGWNAIADAISDLALDLSEFAQPGILGATHFNFASTGGLNGTISGGYALVGGSANRFPVLGAASTTADATGALANTATNYGYLTRDGGITIVQNPMDAPADSVLCFTVTTSGGAVTAIDNLPSGRSNLLDLLAVKVSANDRQAGYLETKVVAGTGITVTVLNDGASETLEIKQSATAGADASKVKVSSDDTTADYLGNKLVSQSSELVFAEVSPAGNEDLGLTLTVAEHTVLTNYDLSVAVNTDKILVLDFSTTGSFPNGGYHVYVTVDGDHDDVLVHELVNAKTGTVLKLYFQNSNSAGAGTYGTAAQIRVTIKVRGIGWTAAGSPTEGTPTLYDFDYSSGGTVTAVASEAEWTTVDSAATSGTIAGTTAHEIVSATGANSTRTLPATPNLGRQVIITKKVDDTYTLTVSANTGQSIVGNDGETDVELQHYQQSVTFVCVDDTVGAEVWRLVGKAVGKRYYTGNGASTIPADAEWVIVSTNTTNATLTLPSTQACSHPIAFKKLHSGNTVTIQRAGSDVIDGGTAKIMNSQYEQCTLVPDAANACWHVF